MTIAHIHLIYFIPLWKILNSPVFAQGDRKEMSSILAGQ